MVGEEKITDDMKKMLTMPGFEDRIFYLRAKNGIDKKTINQANLQHCKNIFFLINTDSVNAENDDKKCLFLAAFLSNNGVVAPIYI